MQFKFTFPQSARLFETDPTSVTIAPLTLEQDMNGSKLVDKSGNVFDKIKMSIRAVDDKPADWVGGGVDAMLDKASPKIRELIGKAYLHVHQTTRKDDEDFLGSMTASV